MVVDQNVSMTACRSVTLNIHKFSDISALTSTEQHTIHDQFSIEPLWSVGVGLHFMCSFSLRKVIMLYYVSRMLKRFGCR